MNLDSLLEDSAKLEKTISALIESNAFRQNELARLKTCVLEKSQYELDQIGDRERKLRNNLETLRNKKNDLEAELKQFTDINEKLSHWVSTAQRANNDKKDKNQELYISISDIIQDYEQLKLDFLKVFNEIKGLHEGHDNHINEIQELVKQSNELVVGLRKNEYLIKVLSEQNKYGEKQFDLITGNLPWEPLTETYIEELRNVDNEHIRSLAIYLQSQANDINDLNESLNIKKEKKLEILEQLAGQLNKFVQKREEATLVDEHCI